MSADRPTDRFKRVGPFLISGVLWILLLCCAISWAQPDSISALDGEPVLSVTQVQTKQEAPTGYVPMVLLFLITATYLVHKFRKENRPSPVPEVEPHDETDTLLICPGCMQETTESDNFCPHCNCPIGPYVTLVPLQPYWALSYGVGKSIHRPPAGMFFWTFLAYLLLCGVYIGVSSTMMLIFSEEITHVWFRTAFWVLSAIFLAIGIAITLLYLYATWRAYGNARAEATHTPEEDC